MSPHLHVCADVSVPGLVGDEGAGLGEYALLLAFIAILAIVGVRVFGMRLAELWQTITDVWPAPGP